MRRPGQIVIAFAAVFALAWSSRADPNGWQNRNPDPPRHLTAFVISAFQIRLSWKANFYDESGFEIERAPDAGGSPGTWSQIATVGGYVRTFNDRSVSANRKYWYRVRAYLRRGDSDYSNLASATSLPLSPSSLTATAVSTNQINLSWTPDISGESGFEIERAPDAGGSPGTWSQIATVGAGLNTFSDTGLEPGTTYWYRVRARNSAGHSAFSNVTSAATPMPPCPLSIAEWGITSGTFPAGLAGVTAIAAGYSHRLALKSDGTVVGWGDNDDGEATPPTNLTGVVAIAAGGDHSLALKSDGTVVGWGYNGNGHATPPANLTGVVAIAAGGDHSLALKSDGTVVGWGYNDDGEATPPTNLTGVVAIAAGGYHSLALKSDGTVVGWGDNSYGEATPPANLTGVVAIAAGGLHSLALKSDGTVVGWGYNIYGDTTPPANLTGVVAIAAGSYHSLALESDGSVVGWGDNSSGEAVPVGLTGGAAAIAAGNSYSLALTFAPSVPSGLWTSIVATNQVDLSWLNNSADEDGFEIERAADNGNNSPGTWARIATVGANATHFSDMGVVTNATYWYRLESFNRCGDSPYSNPASVTIVPPGAPYSISAAIGITNQVNLSWYDSSGNAGAFEIERAPDAGGIPGTWAEIATVSVSSTNNNYYNYSDSGVTTNSTYWYRVRAFNVLGDSAYSDPASISVAPPAAPSLSASAFHDQVNLSFSGYSGGTMGFKIQRAPDVAGSPGSWTDIATLAPSGADYGSYSDTGLAANTTYWYRVLAYNWAGDSPYSSPASVTIVPPGAPNYLSAAIGITNQVNLSWYDYSEDEDGFEIDRAPDAGGSPGTWTEIGTINATNFYSASYIDTNVTAYTTNWYRVRAFNVVGDSAYSDPASISVTPPAAPSLSASAFRDQVNLSFSDYSGGTMELKIQRAPDVAGSPGSWTDIATLAPSGAGYGSYTDTGLAANTTYWYRVLAYNWAGDSPYSSPASVTIVPPGAPYSLSAAIGITNQVILSWYDDSGDEDGFEIDRAPDAGGSPGTWTEIGTINATNFYGASYIDTNVTAYTTNWYRVRAFNVVGDSAYSGPTSISVAPPAAPSLSASAFRDQVNLSFLSYSGYYGGTMGFKIQRAPDVAGSPGSWTDIATLAPSGAEYGGSYTDTGLAANTTYWYRVLAYNWAGDSPYSSPASVTIVPPGAPYYLSATIGITNQVNLSWYDSSGDEDGFEIDRAPDAGGSPGTWTEIGTINATNFYYASYIDTNVTAYTTNWYRVRAFNVVGDSAYSGPTSISVAPPAAPSSLTAAVVASNQVNLSWQDSDYSSASIEGYKIERAPDVGGSPGTWAQIADISGSYYYNYYTDTGVMTNTAYWYRVRVNNWVGDSPYSGLVSVTIAPPPAPSDLTAALVAPNQIGLAWVGNSAADNGFENEFEIDRAPDAGGSPGTWVEIAAVGGLSTNYTDAGVEADMTYWYRVHAYNALGDSPYSASVSITATVQINIDTAQTLRVADARWFGLNTAIWDGYFDTPATLSALRELGCRTLRFPGGSRSDDYHWYSNKSVSDNITWATSPANFAHIATNLGARVFITANYGSGTPAEAAGWVGNSNVTNKFGYKYWEIGNEEYGSWELDYNTNAPYMAHDPWTYAMRFKDYYTAMKAVDPTIKIGMMAVPGEDNYANNYTHSAVNPRTGQTHYGWTPVLLSTLQSLGVTPDFVVHHFYPEYQSDNDAYLLQAAANWAVDAADLRQQINDYLGGDGTNVELVCTENNADSGSQGRQSTSLVDGLYLADSISQLMKTEFNSFVWWDLRNGQDASGDFNASLYGWRTYGDLGIMAGTTLRYPAFYAMKLMQNFVQPGDSVLDIPNSNPLLSAYAARRISGAVSLLVINKDPANAITEPVSLAGVVPNDTATILSYGIPQDEATRTNGTAAAQDIATNSFTAASTNFTYAFPPYSLTLFTFAPARPTLMNQPAAPGNPFVFQLQGQPGVRYTLQTSTNLTQWISVSTNTFAGSTLNFTNPVTPAASMQFWRAIWQP
jgi:titin